SPRGRYLRSRLSETTAGSEWPSGRRPLVSTVPFFRHAPAPLGPRQRDTLLHFRSKLSRARTRRSGGALSVCQLDHTVANDRTAGPADTHDRMTLRRRGRSHRNRYVVKAWRARNSSLMHGWQGSTRFVHQEAET